MFEEFLGYKELCSGPDLGWWGPWGKVFGGGPNNNCQTCGQRHIIIITIIITIYINMLF